jgi:site-specific DNA-methyltransferase (adenine-specific)
MFYSDAIEIARNRLAKPSKTESDLLKLGREAYRTTDEEALALLKGLDIVPVQRNKGIDAFLKDEIDGCPIPIRVQRTNETVLEAAADLYKAAKTRKAPVMLLIAMQGGGYFPFAQKLPPELFVIDGPALSITKILEKFKREQQEKRRPVQVDSPTP